ncbi:hypothetical protein BsWGS_00297 [Bradybaena similaris]
MHWITLIAHRCLLSVLVSSPKVKHTLQSPLPGQNTRSSLLSQGKTHTRVSSPKVKHSLQTPLQGKTHAPVFSSSVEPTIQSSSLGENLTVVHIVCIVVYCYLITEVFNLWSADPWGSAGSFKGVHGQVKESSDFSCIKVLLGLVDWLAFS